MAKRPQGLVSAHVALSLWGYRLFQFSSYKMGVSMSSRLLATGAASTLRKGFFNTFKVQISPFKVQILAFEVQTIFAIPLRSPS